jgi:hypothetical protein
MFKKLYILFSFLPFAALAQFSSGFENIPIDSSLGYYAGSDSSSGFSDNGLFFRNDYNASFQSWNGFALSRKTDSVTAGYENQFSCRAGRAWLGNTFALGYASSRIFIRKPPGQTERRLLAFRLTNNTYAARSMQFGDAFSKKFGGQDGLDPDFFLLKVYNYLNGSISDSASFYLADYRAQGSQNDYILKEWVLAETLFSNAFDSLGFELTSSDNGSFGMNTPAYFCMDEIMTESISSNAEKVKSSFNIFPNPAKDQLYIQSENDFQFEILNASGMKIQTGKASNGRAFVNIAGTPPGCYVVRLSSGLTRRLLVE